MMGQLFRSSILSSGVMLVAFAASAQESAWPTPEGYSCLVQGSQQFSYDSNPLRVTTGEKSLFGSTTSPELILRRKTPVSQIESDTRVDANFFDRSEYNSVDFHEKLHVSKNNQRWTAGLRGTFDYDTTRTSELTNFGLNLPKVHSTRIGATPEVAFGPTERDTWSLSGTVLDATYDNAAFTDYNIYSLSPSYEHKFDPQNTGSFSLRAQRYETSSGPDSRSDSFGPSVGWKTLLTPRLTLKASAGVESVDKNGIGVGTNDSTVNYIFAGNLAFKGTQDTAEVTASRALEPFGNGTETLLTSFTMREEHAINEALSVNVKATYQEADASTPGVNLDHGTQAGGGLAYRLFPSTDLTADYTYRNETLTNVNGTVDEHVVMLGLVYHPPTGF